MIWEIRDIKLMSFLGSADPEVLAEVAALKAQVNNTGQVIGRTHVFLNGEYDTCTEVRRYWCCLLRNNTVFA